MAWARQPVLVVSCAMGALSKENHALATFVIEIYIEMGGVY